MNQIINQLNSEDIDIINHTRERTVRNAYYGSLSSKSLQKFVKLGIMEIKSGCDSTHGYFELTAVGEETYRKLKRDYV